MCLFQRSDLCVYREIEVPILKQRRPRREDELSSEGDGIIRVASLEELTFRAIERRTVYWS